MKIKMMVEVDVEVEVDVDVMNMDVVNEITEKFYKSLEGTQFDATIYDIYEDR